jgi:hypothetical protein
MGGGGGKRAVKRVNLCVCVCGGGGGARSLACGSLPGERGEGKPRVHTWRKCLHVALDELNEAIDELGVHLCPPRRTSTRKHTEGPNHARPAQLLIARWLRHNSRGSNGSCRGLQLQSRCPGPTRTLGHPCSYKCKAWFRIATKFSTGGGMHSSAVVNDCRRHWSTKSGLHDSTAAKAATTSTQGAGRQASRHHAAKGSAPSGAERGRGGGQPHTGPAHTSDTAPQCGCARTGVHKGPPSWTGRLSAEAWQTFWPHCSKQSPPPTHTHTQKHPPPTTTTTKNKTPKQTK